MWHEDEQDIAGLDARAAARWDGVVAPHDDGDERLAWEAKLTHCGACDRVVGTNAKLLQVEHAGSRHLERALRRSRGADEPETPREPLECRALKHDRDEVDEPTMRI